MKYQHFVDELQLIGSTSAAQANNESCSDAFFVCTKGTIALQNWALNDNPEPVYACYKELAFSLRSR